MPNSDRIQESKNHIAVFQEAAGCRGWATPDVLSEVEALSPGWQNKGAECF